MLTCHTAQSSQKRGIPQQIQVLLKCRHGKDFQSLSPTQKMFGLHLWHYLSSASKSVPEELCFLAGTTTEPVGSGESLLAADQYLHTTDQYLHTTVPRHMPQLSESPK